MDGTTFPPENEEYDTPTLTDYGYLFSLKKTQDESIPQGNVVIYHNNIKKVIEQFEYQIEEQDVFKLIENKSNEGITEAEIKEKLKGDGAKFSEKELKNILEKLKGRFKIYNVASTDTWVTMEFSPKGLQLSKDIEIMKEIERTKQPKYNGKTSCENDKKKKFN